MKIVVDRGIKSFEKIVTSINGFDEVEFLYLETQDITNDKIKRYRSIIYQINYLSR